MKADDRCKLVTTIDELTEVRARQIEIGRRQLALEASADQHFDAAAGDLRALCDRETALMDALREQLGDITIPDGDREAYGVANRVRYGFVQRVSGKAGTLDAVVKAVPGIDGAAGRGRNL